MIDTKELEEETNNAFVAVTKSKRRLYISGCKNRTMSWGEIKRQIPSRYIGKYL
jgi:DNA helicase II / ATP-dependent DNA helicase PcrA